jgi:drug/metabolite transporter (DMT)-like permease
MATSIEPRMGAAEWAMLLALSVLWGGSFFFAKVAVGELPPLTVVLGRVGLAAMALLAIVRAAGQRMPRDPDFWAAYFAMGALNNLIPFSLIFWGQTRIASGLAAILNATRPLWTVLLAHLLTRDEELAPNRLAGVLAGLAGVAVMIGPEALAGFGLDLLAQTAVVLAAVSYAFAGIFGRRFRAAGVSPLVTAAGQVAATTVMALPVVLLVDQPWTLPVPSAATCASVVALALLCTALANVLYFRVLATAGAINIALVTFLVPVSAILLGSFVLGERLEPRDFAGMALIGLGLAAIDGRVLTLWRRLAPAR